MQKLVNPDVCLGKRDVFLLTIAISLGQMVRFAGHIAIQRLGGDGLTN